MSLTDEFEAVTVDNEGGEPLVSPRLPLSEGVPGGGGAGGEGVAG